jgi:alkanesulfonate monooxygenase SsuD/methylene tetrahydromethanopterin reductase-like flavin-dependent oxidoreductase (luciferase family)
VGSDVAGSIGVVLGAIDVTPAWWIESAARLDEAGYAGVWCWDHFMVRGGRPKPVLEAWTILSLAAARTTRLALGPFVANVVNRHPAQRRRAG